MSVDTNIDAVELLLKENIAGVANRDFKFSYLALIWQIFFRVPLFYVIFPIPLCVISLPFYLLTLPCLGRAPIVDSCGDICCKRSKACCETRIHRDFACWERYTIVGLWINRIIWVPIVHVWWAIDELVFYGYRQMDDQNDPIILIQGARQGSTSFSMQVFKLLEDEYVPMDPILIMSPFIWQHKLAKCLCGCCWTRQRFYDFLEGPMNPDFLMRHQTHPDEPDTFEPGYWLWKGVWIPSFFAGNPIHEFREFYKKYPGEHIDKDFLKFFQSMMKKCLYLLPPEERHKKVFVKGHFIENAIAIRELYPRAKFLNMVRKGSAPAQSYANFLYVQPHDMMAGVEVCFEHVAVYGTLLTYLYRVWEAEFYKYNDERHMTYYFDDWRKNTEK